MIDTRENADRYLPRIYPEEQPFWDGTAKEELRLQKCGACGHVRYPIGPACPRCLSDVFSWETMTGHGHVQTFAVFHKGWAPWMERMVPYVVAQVEIDEGPRLTTNLLGIPPAEVHIGLEVVACYERIADDVVLLQFAPAAAGEAVG